MHFSFTKLLVADLEASERFYTSVFGLEVAGRVSAEVAGRMIDEIMLKPTAPGGGSLILLRFRDVTGPTNEEVMLGFMVDDLEAATGQITAAGGSVLDPPHDVTGMPIRVAIAADAEGHMIELVQRVQA